MTKVRTAIIGAGFIGRIHAKAVLANAGELAAIIDISPDASKAIQAEFGLEPLLLTFDEVLNDSTIELVHICTPNHLHAEMAMRVIEAGKHVVCEKPLSIDSASADELVGAADRAGVKTGVPFVYRFYAMVREAQSRISEGQLGKLNLIHGSYLQDWLLHSTDYNWRVDTKLGGASRAFGDIGVHWCDLIEFVSGEQIDQVIANVATVQDRQNFDGDLEKVASEDVVTVLFKTASGVMGSTVISQVSAGRPNEIKINFDGSSSAIAFNQMLPESLWVGNRGQNSNIYRGADSNYPSTNAYSFTPAGHPQGYQDCFNAFYRDMVSIIRGKQIPGFPTFKDGARAAKITDAILRSASNQSWTGVNQ